MNALRKLLLWLTSGGLVGGFTASLAARYLVPKFNAPISGVYAQCDCASVTLGTASSMFTWTFIGTIGGALLGLVLGVLGAMGGGKKQETPPASPKSA
jgi:hypothetical protein